MNPSEYIYPLDLTGTQPSNRITAEKHTVNPPNDITHASFIVLRACPFYEKTLVVKDGKSATARVLVEGQDYICTHQSITLSHFTKQPVFASISFVDRQYTGTVYVDYNTVGGEYVLDDYTIVEKMTRELYSIHHVSFDQIAGVPSSYPNAPHMHEPTSLVGLDEVVAKLTEIAAALRGNEGSYAQLTTSLQHHLITTTAHGPGDVGLGKVKNYDPAVIRDIELNAPNKYVTANMLNAWVVSQIQVLKDFVVGQYPTSEAIALRHPNKDEVYVKGESDNLYYAKNYIDANFTRIESSLTEVDVGQIINNIVDTSQYLTRGETANTYYSRDQSDTRYYTKSQSDQRFITHATADNRYLQLLDENAILSNRPDNTLSILAGQKLYTGRLAKEDVYHLYIDCINGSDNHDGTKDKPLRTLERANELTPSNRSNFWHLKHYTLDQMEKANDWYDWTFDMTISDGAVRHLSLYGNTWLDGAKYQQASQLGDGSIFPMGIKELSRLPVYCRTYLQSGTENIFSVVLNNGGKFVAEGLRLIKPLPAELGAVAIGKIHGRAFFYGQGKVNLIGCELMQAGTYKESYTTAFCWLSQNIEHHSEMIFDTCSYGYTNEKWLNDIKIFEDNVSSVFAYIAPEERPFQYLKTTGILKVAGTINPGAGAIAAGATQHVSNMSVCVQRPKMFRGLNIINGVCVNVQTNLALVE